MLRPVFRKVAVGRLSSPDQLDHLMRVTSPMAWLALVASGMVLVVALVWGFLGSIPTKIEGQGILIKGGRVETISSPTSGQIAVMLVQLGDTVSAGQKVVRITETATGVVTDVVTPGAGVIVEITVDAGAFVERGTRLLSLIDESRALEAIIYLPSSDGKLVEPGDSVDISPSTVAREEYGFMQGKVISVGDFPSTYEGMYRVLKNEDLVTALRAGGAPIEVHVSVELDANTLSGYKWSSSRGPAFSIDSGTLASASVTVDTRKPISLILPMIR